MTRLSSHTRARIVAGLLVVFALVLGWLLIRPGAEVLLAQPPVPSGQNGFIAVIPPPNVKSVSTWSETYLVDPTNQKDIAFSLFIALEVPDGTSNDDSKPTVLMQGPFADALHDGDCSGTELRPKEDPETTVPIATNRRWDQLNVVSQEASKQYFSAALIGPNGSDRDAQNLQGLEFAKDAKYTVVYPLLADYTDSSRSVDTDAFDNDIDPGERYSVVAHAVWVEMKCIFDGDAMWNYDADIRELRHPALIVIDSGVGGKSQANLWIERFFSVSEFPLVQFLTSNAIDSTTGGHLSFYSGSASGALDNAESTGLRAAMLDSVSVQFRDQEVSDRRSSLIALAGIAAGAVGSLILAVWRILTQWGTASGSELASGSGKPRAKRSPSPTA